MPSTSVKRVLDALELGGSTVKGGDEHGWDANCLSHDDRHASLHVGEGQDGRALVHCHKGCPIGEIAVSLGLAVSELFEPEDHQPKRVVAEYPYVDEQGEVLYKVVRFAPKGFAQCKPDGTWGLERHTPGAIPAPARP